MESFSTRGLPTPRKIAYWNALSSETFAAMEVTPRDAAAFDGELRREPVGPLTLMDVRSAAVRIRHTRAHIARVNVPSYLLLTPLRGDFQMSLEHQSPQRVTTGEYCLLDHARPYELQHGDAVRVLCIDIPRAALQAQLDRPDAAVGRVMRGDGSLSRLLALLLREIGGELEPAAPAPFVPALAQGLLGFVAAAYAEAPAIPPGKGLARRRTVLARIDARLTDPGLSPADVARDLGLSTRRLRAVLAEGDESFSTYVLRRRLERCAELLRDRGWEGRSITEIAFRSGFNNATHFGYAFKRRYGMAPRDYRAAGARRDGIDPRRYRR